MLTSLPNSSRSFISVKLSSDVFVQFMQVFIKNSKMQAPKPVELAKPSFHVIYQLHCHSN